MSRGTLDPALSTRLSLTGLSPSLAGFPKTILLGSSNQFRGPNPGMTRIPVWAPPISLAATLEITVVFSSSGYLDVSVHRVPSLTYGLGQGCLRAAQAGFPIQKSPDQWVFAPPRSFSQLITSFIGS